MMIHFRGMASVTENKQLTLQNALIQSAANAAREAGYQAGFQEGYARGMEDVRANAWGYVEKIANEFAMGVRS